MASSPLPGEGPSGAGGLPPVTETEFTRTTPMIISDASAEVLYQIRDDIRRNTAAVQARSSNLPTSVLKALGFRDIPHALDSNLSFYELWCKYYNVTPRSES